MWLLILEALGALVLLVLLVWWTMFAGRRRGEREPSPEAQPGPQPEPSRDVQPGLQRPGTARPGVAPPDEH